MNAKVHIFVGLQDILCLSLITDLKGLSTLMVLLLYQTLQKREKLKTVEAHSDTSDLLLATLGIR
jgi:hypothetical protein